MLFPIRSTTFGFGLDRKNLPTYRTESIIAKIQELAVCCFRIKNSLSHIRLHGIIKLGNNWKQMFIIVVWISFFSMSILVVGLTSIVDFQFVEETKISLQLTKQRIIYQLYTYCNSLCSKYTSNLPSYRRTWEYYMGRRCWTPK